MPYDIYVIYTFYDIYDISDMYGALSYTKCMYVDIGVKRSIRTSGMQPTIVDIPQKRNSVLLPFFGTVVILQFLALKRILWDIYDGWLHS